MLHYFRKSLPNQKYYSAKGKLIDFPIYGPPKHAIGLLEVDSATDGETLAELQMAVANGGVGGIREITAELFEQLKKKLANLPSPPASRPGPFGDQPLQIVRKNQDPFARKPVARAETPFQRLVREETGTPPPPLVKTEPARNRRPRTGTVKPPALPLAPAPSQ